MISSTLSYHTMHKLILMNKNRYHVHGNNTNEQNKNKYNTMNHVGAIIEIVKAYPCAN